MVPLGLAGLLTPAPVQLSAIDIRPAQSRRGILLRKSPSVITRFYMADQKIGLGAGPIVPLKATWFYVRFNITEVFSGLSIKMSSIATEAAAASSSGIPRRIGLVLAIVTAQLESAILMQSARRRPHLLRRRSLLCCMTRHCWLHVSVRGDVFLAWAWMNG